MENFELARNEEERREKFIKLENYIKTHGIKEEWKIKDILKEKEEDFGLDNSLPEIKEYESKRLEILFKKRQEIIEKYNEIRPILTELLSKEETLWNELENTGQEICSLEGHRLSQIAHPVHNTDGYNRGYTVWYRKCIICGKEISQAMMHYTDCVVKGEEGPKRILYHYKDNK